MLWVLKRTVSMRRMFELTDKKIFIILCTKSLSIHRSLKFGPYITYIASKPIAHSGHFIVMTRIETKLSIDVPAPVSGESALNVATATSKCYITFLLCYDQDGNFKGKQDNVSNIL